MKRENSENFMVIAFTVQKLLVLKILHIFVSGPKSAILNLSFLV